MDKVTQSDKQLFDLGFPYFFLYIVAKGFLPDIERYYNEGRDMTIADYDKRNALHIAAAEGHYDIVVFLLTYCQIDLFAKDRWGHTSLDEAVRFGHVQVEAFMKGYNCALSKHDIVQTSLEGGAWSPVHPDNKTIWTAKRLNIAHKGDLESLKMHINNQYDWLQIADYDKRTVLHVAASDGHADIVSYLMDLHMDLTVTDRWGFTPFEEALKFGKTDVMDVLKEYMTDDQLAKVITPTVQQLYQIARKIGKGWKLFGVQLGVTLQTMEQIEMDNDTAIERIGRMLCAWKEINDSQATFDNLFKAMRSVGIKEKDACEGLKY